jgi:hypothetical protein
MAETSSKQMENHDDNDDVNVVISSSLPEKNDFDISEKDSSHLQLDVNN